MPLESLYTGMFRYAPPAIARAIVTDPDLILTDEPTGNLDANSAQEVLTLLSRPNREFGRSVAMVTHDLHAVRFASKIPYLEKGDLLPEGQAPADWTLPAAGGRLAAIAAAPRRAVLRWPVRLNWPGLPRSRDR